MLSQELIAQIRKIELRAGHLVTDALAGEYVSAFKGQGMEFDEVRAYIPGDDVRTIDWNVSARTGEPYVKIFREEREQTLMIAVDVSPSQAFGTTLRSKNEVSAELAAILAFLAIRNKDKVGLICFSDYVEKYIPPKKGRGHIWRIIREVLTHKGEGKGTDIASGLDFFQRVCKRKSVCFLISDFKTQKEYERVLSVCAKKHVMICAKVVDPREEIFPSVGFLELQDNETGERIVVNTSDAKFVRAFQDLAQKAHQKWLNYLRAKKIGSFCVETHKDIVPTLVQFFRAREKLKRS